MSYGSVILQFSLIMASKTLDLNLQSLHPNGPSNSFGTNLNPLSQ